jgi:hypothetical protein
VSREATPPPAALVTPAGELTYGVWNAPLQDVDLDRARPRLGGIGLPMAAGRLRLKQWQHVCVCLPDLLLTFAIVDTGYLRLSWCHVAPLGGEEAFEHRRMGPHLKARIARALWQDRTELATRGYRIEIANSLAVGEHRVSLAIDRRGALPAISAELRIAHDLSAVEPLVVCLPLGNNRGMYSHKVPLPVSGRLRVGDDERIIDGDDSFAILDIHKAHYPRHTWWNWATLAGRDREGRAVGLNLTRNVCLDEERLNENAVWLEGKLTRLGPARFAFQRHDPLEPWYLTTTDGAVELEFLPRGKRSERIRLGLIRSVFHQPFGRFRGRIRVGNTWVEIDGPAGVCEDHDAIW